jgi:hypothetical protein
MKKKPKKTEEEAGFGAFVRKHQVLLTIVVLALLIGPGAFFVIQSLVTQSSQEREAERFAGVVADFLAPPKKTGPAPNVKPKGPMLPIDVQERKVDRLLFELPESLRPTSPEAVATIVWLSWREETVGKYANGSPSCIEWCDVTVLDRAQRIVLAEKQFRGGDPPKTLSRNLSKGVGPRPYKEISDYLVSLSR